MKQETLPQLGTTEFNDLASQMFGGKPKQETLEEEIMYKIMDGYVDDVMGGCNLRAKEWFEQNKKK